MSIFDSKLNLLNEIAALRSLNSFPKLKTGNSLGTLNNSGNALNFLIDLIKTLVGFEQIKEELIRFLTYQTNSIEATIKLVLKQILKSKFSCSIDALIPNEFITDGFNVAIKQIDFFNILKVNPETIGGQLIYGNIQQDLNAYLYDILQNNTGSWKNLITVTYLQQGIVDGNMHSNVLNVKINPSWGGKTVNDFINTFIEKVIIFTLPQLVNKIFDLTFGSIGNLIGKSANTVSDEVKFNVLIEKIISLPDIQIDDSYYEFSKDDLNFISEQVNQLVNGVKVLKDCGFVTSSVNPDDLSDMNNQLNATSELIEIRQILINQISIFAEQATDNLDELSKPYGKLNFFENLLKGVIKALANIIFAPKIMLFFVTYFKIVSNTIGFKNFEDFFSENQQFIVDLVRKNIASDNDKFPSEIGGEISY